jgi:hypothetical protein
VTCGPDRIEHRAIEPQLAQLARYLVVGLEEAQHMSDGVELLGLVLHRRPEVLAQRLAQRAGTRERLTGACGDVPVFLVGFDRGEPMLRRQADQLAHLRSRLVRPHVRGCE